AGHTGAAAPPLSSFGRSVVSALAGAGARNVLTVRADRRPDARERARTYLDSCPPAVSGQGGHDQTFAVARSVVYGFGLGPEAGFDLLRQHYNPRCQPPWSEAELRHKCKEADTKPFDKPRGHLLAEGEGGGGSANGHGEAAVAGGGVADAAEDI